MRSDRILSPPTTAALAAAFLIFTLLAIQAPLASYALALAAFGLPHVLSELRYIDQRFGARLGRRWLLPIAVLLPLIVAIRAGTVFHLLTPKLGAPAELAGVAVLALSCARGTAPRRAAAIAVGLAIGGATLASPFTTAVTLAILHNLTPLGFFWQIAPPGRRGPLMSVALAGLLGAPLLVASGIPRAALGLLAAGAPSLDVLGAGPLADNLFVYVPAGLVASPHAIDLFTASVVAQGAHYLSVIVMLPLLRARLDPRARGLAPWPKGWLFALLCAGVGAVSLAGFMQAFGQARLIYGLLASVHAWIEIPILILALTGAGAPPRPTPGLATHA